MDTPEKAYILGFIIADGYVHRGGKVVSIALKESDAAHLRKIADQLNCEAPLHRKVNKNGFGGVTRTVMVLNLSRRQLTRDLNTLGVYSNKTYTATYPLVPSELESHLVRGLFDGDGWIGQHQFCLVGTDHVTEGVAAAVKHHTDCDLRLDRKNGFLYVRGSARDCAAMHWMYADGSISLDRKAEAYREFWSCRVPEKARPGGRYR